MGRPVIHCIRLEFLPMVDPSGHERELGALHATIKSIAASLDQMRETQLDSTKSLREFVAFQSNVNRETAISLATANANLEQTRGRVLATEHAVARIDTSLGSMTAAITQLSETSSIGKGALWATLKIGAILIAFAGLALAVASYLHSRTGL